MREYLSLDTLAAELDDDGILTITIKREDHKNALDTHTIASLREVCQRALDDELVRAIVITGSGKVFGIGADIPEIAKSDPAGMNRMIAQGNETYTLIERGMKPVVAAINGVFCLGGSLELALACHFRIASKKVRLGLPEVSLGLIPGYGGTQRLPRLIGKARAIEMILTGDPIKAEKAEEIGLVNQVCDAGEEVAEAKKLLTKKVLKNGPRALGAAIRAIHDGFDLPLEDGIKAETEQFGKCRATADADEGLNAQLEGRKPAFRGV